MKAQKVFLVTAIVFITLVTSKAYAQNAAVKSDIKAFIDYTPINSYNIDGYTYVIAEQLSDYGFEVLWNEEKRALNINRIELALPVYTKELWNKSFEKIGSLYDIYGTDIKTYLDGYIVNSYNIGGQTVIQFDELAKYGGFDWNSDTREVSATIFQNELLDKFNSAENKSIINHDVNDKIDYYEGQTDVNGHPSGVGLMKISASTGSAGVSYVKQDEIMGLFENGKPSGTIFLKRFLVAGKVGETESIVFLGKIDDENYAKRSRDFIDNHITNVVREPNLGVAALPHYGLYDYIGAEVFLDSNIYLDGVWCEINGYRGQKGISFRTWKNQEYQTILETKASDYQGTQIIKFFTEYINGIKTYEK